MTDNPGFVQHERKRNRAEFFARHVYHARRGTLTCPDCGVVYHVSYRDRYADFHASATAFLAHCRTHAAATKR